MLYKIIIEKDENGGYVTFCPALPGCYSQGETRKEALKNMKEAIECHIESLKKQGKKIPDSENETDIEILEVSV